MSALVKVRPSPMPKSWKDAIAAARKAGAPEVAVQLIATAAAPGKIAGNGWHLEAAEAALRIIDGLPRSRARCGRLRGLVNRLRPRKESRPVDQWHLVGGTLDTLLLCVRRHPSRRVRASGTYEDMHRLLTEARRRWADLPCGREIETLETERISKS